MTTAPTVIKSEPIHDNRIGITHHDAGRTTRYFYVTGDLTNWCQTSGITDVTELNEQTDDATKQFVSTLLAIRGVSQIIWLEKNRLILQINPMFLWEQIQDQVLAAIHMRLGWTTDNTTVLSYEDFSKLARQHDAETLPVSHLG
ncbi:MAG: hypothetical protein JWN38_1147 [Candidatus Saccharibacteria bacterium]|nr:hypothetical protein [Candidatus Saccharibacteria bacterium]